MLSFFGLRKEQSKKPGAERELDGFVIIGETMEEQRQKMQSMNIAQPSTNVVIQPAKPSRNRPMQPGVEDLQASMAVAAEESPSNPLRGEAAPSLPELLADVPFTLAPHILAMQAGIPRLPDILLTTDVNHNLDSFRYDFTLENSVLNQP